ncbi:uncharacterized protein LY79DRAFT_567462 [Colletotrichum navitas]|uniref:Uncharacterized protein n=1 Tax=Colletotrichum navitas TaxID=681940 RepID=A0AAD8PQR2_9PEZI|nr:uncharacterized protein LY79DRAFT_567462 [Colletotrichum navitas]KAK1573953.1 hypothetical protein LY79DRAFT_567462 [Colletotrichum navitas]
MVSIKSFSVLAMACLLQLTAAAPSDALQSRQFEGLTCTTLTAEGSTVPCSDCKGGCTAAFACCDCSKVPC